MNQIDFYENNEIKWFPINVKITKIKKPNGEKGCYKSPSYPEEYDAKCEQNDFKTLTDFEIVQRQELGENCNAVAVDTNDIYVIDVDFEDDIDYEILHPEAFNYVKGLIQSNIPYKKSNTKKKGKHFFIKPTKKIEGNRVQLKYKHIEVLSGQWAFSPKSRTIKGNGCIEEYDLTSHLESPSTKPKKRKKFTIKKKVKTPINNLTEVKPMNQTIKKYADLITKKYIDEYDSWTKIIWALANDEEDHYEIAKYISMKSQKYDEDSLRNLWNQTRGGSSMGTFYYYCKLSNPDKYLLEKALDSKHTFCLDDDSIAEIFFNEFGDNLVYKDEILYVFNDSLWYEDRKLLKVKYFIGKVIKEYYLKVNIQLSKKAYDELTDDETNTEKQIIMENLKVIGKILDKMGTATKKKNVAECLLQIIAVRDYSEIEFDTNSYILPFKDNVYDLASHTFRTSQKEDYILTFIPYKLEQRDQEKIDKFDSLIQKIFPNPAIKENYFAFLTTALYGQHVEKFIIANGGGGNGKGLINELMEELLSVFCYKCSNAVLLQPLKEGINTQVANMDNKRLIIYSEPDSTVKKICGSTMKELTGGKGISAERKYSMNNKVVLKATHIMETNSKPKIDGRIDDSYIRRLVDIPFVSTFTNDKQLLSETDRQNTYKADTSYKTEEWKKEYKHILFWYLIDFSKAYKLKYGYECIEKVEICDEVINRTKEYLENSDEKFDWFKNTYQKKKGEYIQIKDIFDFFKQSDYYINLPKKDKREENYTNFIKYIMENVNFRAYYREKYTFYEGQNQKVRRNVLLGWSYAPIENENDDEDEGL